MESDKESDVLEKPSEIPWLEQLKDYFKVYQHRCAYDAFERKRN
jgi:hypothetical protein